MLLAFEREMLGLYVSDHPLLGVEHVLAQVADVSVAGLMIDEDRPDGAIVTIAGSWFRPQRQVTKQGNPWAIATIEDLDGAIDVMFFPATYTLSRHPARRGRGRPRPGPARQARGDPRLIAMEMSLPDLRVGARGPVVISLPTARCIPPVVERLKECPRDATPV